MELNHLSLAELTLYLDGHLPTIRELRPENRDAVVRMAHRLVQRGLAQRFVLASVNNTVELLRAPERVSLPGAPSPEELSRPAGEPHQMAARRLADTTRSMLTEARAARRSNEVRRMRDVLRGIDRGHLRQSLGEEGDTLCREIEHILARLAAPVRRGRPRTAV